MEFSYKFPAIKGIQANKEYYTTMVPLKLLPKLFIFNEEDEEMPAEFKSQRSLNTSRIPTIGEYIINNPNTYVFSSLTASIDGKMKFEATSGKDIGYLNIELDARFLINDGQHRKAAIEYALKKNKSLENETISIVMFKDIDLIRSQQMFADLNRHAITPTKSIGILYDSTDKFAIATKKFVSRIDILKYYTDKEKSNLGKYSAKAFTLSNLYNATKKIFNNIDTNIDDEFLYTFWNNVCKNIKEFEMLSDKKISASELRQSYTVSQGTTIEALSLIGNYFYINDIKNSDEVLKGLKNINWHRENKEWFGRLISNNGRITKNLKAIKLTSILIKQKLNIPLNTEEQKLEKEFVKNGK